MKLEIKNFAKIDSADIEINGLTVIAGENNTGKSTVGKLLFSLYHIFNSFDTKVMAERKETILNALFNVTEFRDEVLELPYNENERKNLVEKIEKILDDLLYIDLNELDGYFEKLGYRLTKKVRQEIESAKQFETNKLKSLIVNEYLSAEFKNQYLPIFKTENEPRISIRVKNRENVLQFEEGIFNIIQEIDLEKECIYIDNPFAIDDCVIRYRDKFYDILSTLFKETKKVSTHKEHLKEKLTRSLKNANSSSLIGDAILDERLAKFKELIKKVIHGGLVEKDDKFVFLDHETNKELELDNLSTGIKSFTILLKLIENRDITDKSMIVLDEPEIHLHPEWQLKFAELLVMLQKEFDLNFVLTSHSPYFIEAIEVYSAKHEIADRCKYYLAELENNKAVFEDVTLNIENIYKKLASPLTKLAEEESRLNDYD